MKKKGKKVKKKRKEKLGSIELAFMVRVRWPSSSTNLCQNKHKKSPSLIRVSKQTNPPDILSFINTYLIIFKLTEDS